MNILGIESSCDETACAVVKDGREVLANVVYTQIKLHQPWGGVVPEIASRAHVEKISGVIAEAVRELEAKTGKGLESVDAVAVTYGPGLASSLLVGLAAAKGLALALGKPLIGVNHIEAHLHTPFLCELGDTPCPAPEDLSPALGLAVSGGHTTWIEMPTYGEYAIIGQTLDDAAGEAFDKAAKLLGLGYPGGPVIDRVAKEYFAGLGGAKPDLIAFPKGRPRAGVSALAGLDADYCTSFSGLKTALLNYVNKTYGAGADRVIPAADLPRIVASYQEAIVAVLADRTARALKRRAYKALIVGGGVSLNGRLRAKLGEVAAAAGVPLLLAKPKFCGDNAAMIAGLAHYRRNLVGDAALATDVNPTLQPGD
ncbi:MAG: tRNA (adenosine(37)-N6)-threonylcarbamoyltransferase complex transferase subunit TsaD [Kiritimatiellae bacterium]|nr:tRNA (adenosine(37)-N6)-threonylcarbamoyltransferase complex transferase subunit TsaD [Kiritimatiellia bacterium]